MSKKIFNYLILLIFLPAICFADKIVIKESAPEAYVVVKGDTLWDISNMYLSQPWLWPQLWRTNVHIINPHLIYPGDELFLRIDENGQPVIDLVRNGGKTELKISPAGDKVRKPARPISTLPWSIIKAHLDHDMIMTQQDYDMHPYILGDEEGSVRFVTDDLVLSQPLNDNIENYWVVRQQNKIHDLEGNLLGLQVRHLADAKPFESTLEKQVLIEIKQARLEVKRGDKLMPAAQGYADVVELVAAQEQRGNIVDDLEQHNLLGKHDVVILDLGEGEVTAGTVMGIYAQGPNIIDSDNPKYEGETSFVVNALSRGDEIKQPALRVGEVVVFKVFNKASYALITQSTKLIRKGAIVAKP
jgi:hypothetical protein